MDETSTREQSPAVIPDRKKPLHTSRSISSARQTRTHFQFKFGWTVEHFDMNEHLEMSMRTIAGFLLSLPLSDEKRIF